MEESSQVQELNQTMQSGFNSVSLAIDNLRLSNNQLGNSILMVILIIVLVSININLKKLVELNASKKK
jgi:hypothetical protein